MKPTVSAWVAKAEKCFAEKSVPEASANAEFLMAAVLKTGRGQIVSEGQRLLTARQRGSFWSLVSRRCRRVPLAYVLGSQPFMGLDIRVGPAALIPRPETEEVVETAAGFLKRAEIGSPRILELGTGTGCIALALSGIFPKAALRATDISASALKLAKKNARGSGILFFREDFKSGTTPANWADLVISNPPYIPSGEIKNLEPELFEEPRLALDGGPDGLDALRAVIREGARCLKPGGFLVLEIGSGQGMAVRRLLEVAEFKDISIRKDLQGLERIASACF